MKLKKGDQVKVLSGKDRGKQGTITRAVPEKNKVIVEGVNVVKRHTRSAKADQPGGILDKEMPVASSAVAIVCPSCGPSKIGYRYDDSGSKNRVCRKCGGQL